MSNSFATPWTVATRLLCPCHFPSKNLEWIAISFSRGSSQPRDWIHVFHIGRWVLYHWATREALPSPTFRFMFTFVELKWVFTNFPFLIDPQMKLYIILSIVVFPSTFSYYSYTLSFFLSICSTSLHNLNVFPSRK